MRLFITEIWNNLIPKSGLFYWFIACLLKPLCAVTLVQAPSLPCLSLSLQISWKTSTSPGSSRCLGVADMATDCVGSWLSGLLAALWVLQMEMSAMPGWSRGQGRGHQENKFTSVLEPCQILIVTSQSSPRGIAGISFLLSYRIRPWSWSRTSAAQLWIVPSLIRSPCLTAAAKFVKVWRSFVKWHHSCVRMQMGVGQVTQIGDRKTHATYLNFSVEL